MSTYRVTFEQIDHESAVEPMLFEDVSEDPRELASLVYERSQPYVASLDLDCDVDVAVDLDDMSGTLYAPIRRFTVERTTRDGRSRR